MIVADQPVYQLEARGSASHLFKKEAISTFEQLRAGAYSGSHSWIVARRIFLLQQLSTLSQECSEDSWDGEGASQISPGTVHLAASFLMTLPAHLPDPVIGASPQGDVSFEWAQSTRRIVSAAISEDGTLHYAWLINDAHGHQEFSFSGSFDQELAAKIENVLG
jgi:hypothetical protein